MKERTWLITEAESSFASSDFSIDGSALGFGPNAYCRKRTLSGGRQAGVELIELSNGVVSLRVCPTRGMGIIDGRFGERPLGWRSPVREIVHPQYINLYDLGGRGAHYGFNELLNRCGIEWSGAMGEDRILNNMGDEARVFLPLHGKVGWTPALRVELRCDGEKIVLEGDVPEANVFGVSYLLRTTLTLTRGSARIEISDRLENLGASPGEYEMLYHTNFGPPFLEAGGRYYGSYDRVVPRDRFAAAGMEALDRFGGPEREFVEQVFLFRAVADRRGFAHQLLVNRAGDLAVRVGFGIETLPYAILWKRCASFEEGYVVGLNPCSDLPNPRSVEREAGRLATVDAGGEIRFHHSIEPLAGTEAVGRAVAGLEHFGPEAAVGGPGDFAFLSSL